MKLIKNSPELIDMEMIGLKSFQYYYNSSDIPTSSNSTSNNLATNINCNEIIDSNSSNLDMIINQNGLTYEQLQNIIEELLSDANYHLDNLKYLRYIHFFTITISKHIYLFFFIFKGRNYHPLIKPFLY